ncbi:SAM-dependent methyltransferase [Nitrosovibrio tenuis]|uniref:Spermine/spermidine synthase n=1 Tax=Nitrosovibrio tenuis TaxID=1233 RepID=A0A1H7RNT9_9PROT|nr:SAM-dependent methyltransferase [Nitrosovibrio tenuis]SEL61494.1 Spermine/spermidine synthase [Nitrosovibrio tenuis]
MPMSRPPLIAISLLSACMLAYEVVLTRLFSMVLWHHFAYMIISAAMLGYGASGTALALLKEKIAPHFGAVYLTAAAAMAFLMPAAFLLAQQVPYNPLELLWDTTQPAKLLAIYLLMMLPFFCGGLSIGLVWWRFGREAGRIYAYDMLGAGAGSLGVIGVLFLLPPERFLIMLTALALLAAAIAVIELQMKQRSLMKAFIGLALLVAVVPSGNWLEVRPSPYKDLSQTLHVAGAHVVAERSSPLGQITVVENTRIPFRHAPGMSLNSTDEPAPQLAIFVDGDGPSVLTRFDGELAPLDYLDQLTSALPYHVLETPHAEPHVRRHAGPHVLVLGAGAGSDVLQALYRGAGEVDAVELDRNIIDLVKKRFHEFAGDLYIRPDVHVHEAEARGFVNATHKRFDLIQVALLDSFGIASAGLYGLSESYLYTVEALQTYLSRLTPGGVLAITRWLSLPPRDTLKLFATAAVALEREGIANPAARLVMIRGWKTVTLLVKNGDFTGPEIDAIKQFSRERSFDVAYYPGMRADEANHYNLLDKPYFFEGATALLSTQRQSFIDRYKFYIEPATDNRPYFFRFFKWSAAAELFALRKQGGMPLLDWSYPLLAATLVQAFIASILLILAPLAVSRARRSLPPGRMAFYFLAIGLAFMFMEIAFIQKFVLFLAHPLYAIAVVLCAFLVFAAAGSRLAGRWHGNADAGRYLILAVAGIAAFSLLYLALLPYLFRFLIHLPDAAKIPISIALIAPLALCMGIPFPTGMARLASTADDAIPWAWAINGFASVIGAVLATLLAIHLGFAAVILLAVLIYTAAAAALRGQG